MHISRLSIIVATFAGLMFSPSSQNASANAEVARLLSDYGVEGKAAVHIRGCFEQASYSELPINSLLLRLREGLVKSADGDVLLAALERRLEALAAARQIAVAGGHGRRREAVTDSFLETLARGLESGMAADWFHDLIAGERGAFSQRMQAIVEAGELMHLAGVDGESIRQFMQDCKKRNLRRMETLRAARLWIQWYRDAVDPVAIRMLLWEAMASSSNPCKNGGGLGIRGRNRRSAAP